MTFLSLISIVAEFTPKDLFDIAMVALLIYLVLLFIRESRSFFIFSTAFILFGISFLSRLFDLSLTQEIIQPFITFFFLIIIIVFQRELRRFFEWFSLSGRLLARKRKTISAGIAHKISYAVEELVKAKTGALMVLAGEHPIERSIENGIELNGVLSVPLLLSIFDPSSPGHDGAVVIDDGKIKYFGAHLPLGEGFKNLDKGGTRHRAALGLSEETDALVIVVSEERGVVSLAQNGRLQKVSKEEFNEKIHQFIHEQEKGYVEEKGGWWRYIIFTHPIEKVAALLLSIILWLTLIVK